MEDRKDIGKMIEERLQDTTMTPADLEWERVSSSLDKRDRKRRFLLIIWTGIALTGLTVSGMLFYNGYDTTEKTPFMNEDIVAPTIQIESNKAPVSIDRNEKEQQTSTTINKTGGELESMQPSITSPQKQANDQVGQDTRKEPEITKIVSVPTKAEEWVTKSQDDITETFTVDSITTYRYYNHDTENEFITTNKKTIDSLVKISETVVDSLH